MAVKSWSRNPRNRDRVKQRVRLYRRRGNSEMGLHKSREKWGKGENGIEIVEDERENGGDR